MSWLSLLAGVLLNPDKSEFYVRRRYAYSFQVTSCSLFHLDLSFGSIDARLEFWDRPQIWTWQFWISLVDVLYEGEGVPIIVGGGKLINISPCFCSVFICVGDTQECSKNLFEKLINHGTEFLKKSFRLWCIPLTHVQLNYHSKITIKNILS